MEAIRTKEIDNISSIIEASRLREERMLENSQEGKITPIEIRLMITDLLKENPEAKEIIKSARESIISAQLGISLESGIFIAGQCALDNSTNLNGEAFSLNVPMELHKNSSNYQNIINISRACWQKPRSGTGPAGLYHEPYGAEFALNNIYIPLIEKGIPFALETIDHQDPLRDAMSYAWLGARSVGHNPLWYAAAANPNCPIGLKNSEDGTLDKVNNVAKAIRSNTQVNMDGTYLTTAGNHFINTIYRGGRLNGLNLTDDKEIKSAFQNDLLDTCQKAYIMHNRILLDISHGNAKLFTKGERDEKGQLLCFDAFKELAEINPIVMQSGEHNAPRDITFLDMTMGVMAEVSMIPGRNQPGDVIAGRSNVDACLGIEDGLKLQEELNDIYSMSRDTSPIWTDHPAFTS